MTLLMATQMKLLLQLSTELYTTWSFLLGHLIKGKEVSVSCTLPAPHTSRALQKRAHRKCLSTDECQAPGPTEP